MTREIKPGINTFVTVLEKIVIGSKMSKERLPKNEMKKIMQSMIYFTISQWD